MNSISTFQTRDKLFIYAVLVCLFLTTFPLAQGWLSIGDFIPRFAFLAIVMVLYSHLLFTIDTVLLVIYFLYMIICGAQKFSPAFLANVMEQLLPLVLAKYFLDKNNHQQAIVFARIMVIISVFIMVNTIIVDVFFPNIVRTMVVVHDFGEVGEGQYYKRMGVCLYSFAMISMCLAPVFLYLSKIKRKFLLLLFFFITCYFVYIAGITTCLLILIGMLILFILSAMNKMHLPVFISIIVGLLLYSTGLVLVESVLPLLEGSNFYGHLGGIMEFYGRSTIVTETYNVEARAGLYRMSLDVFLHNPLLGNARAINGGHSFFLDHLASMGLLGMTPFFIYLFRRFREAYYRLNYESRTVYLICIIGFLIMGALKAMNGIDFWTYMFVYIPCLLKLSENETNLHI